MPILNFKKQFAGLVETGTKRQTIRATRKHPIKVGDKLYLYTGLRTKQCRKLREATCTEIKNISIYAKNGLVRVNAHYLSPAEKQKLAESDGFAEAYEFFEFFKTVHGLPFHGQIIKWQ